MFDLSSLQYNSDNPTLVAILFTVLCALFLGILIAFTYEKTTRGVDRPYHFLQALVLITIVASMIIQAIGDSVARGLGMLGALSIIRFRTTVRNPRNIVFMFGAIAAGIACGVFGFTIAIVGTLSFCATAFLLRLSTFSPKKSLVGTLRIEVPRDYETFPELETILEDYCRSYVLISYKVYTGEKKENILLYEYRLKLKDSSKGGHLVAQLKTFEGLRVVGLTFQNNASPQI